MPFISICIPAYQRTHYLRRLFESIVSQTFTDFEIIVTDDSPGPEVQQLCKAFSAKLPVQYYTNPAQLGTPENWNEGIRKATGQWIKIMHDDDWFALPESLALFAATAQANPHAFIFSAYSFVYEKEKREQLVRVNSRDLKRLKANPLYLYRTNYIGNPSCTLYRRKAGLSFDRRFKWVVDFEFYIRYLTTTEAPPVFITQPLVNVGVNDTQVTTYTFRVPAVEVPENHRMLAGQGFQHLKNIFIYDYFWRLYRNLHITTTQQVAGYGYPDKLPPVLASMIQAQQKIPGKLLRFGPASKMLMLLHYLRHKKEIRD